MQIAQTDEQFHEIIYNSTKNQKLVPLRRNFRSHLCLKNSRSREKNFRRVPMWWTHSA